MYLPMCSCQLRVGLTQPLASVGEAPGKALQGPWIVHGSQQVDYW